MFLDVVDKGFCLQMYAGISASLGGFCYTSVFGWVTPILPRLLSDQSEVPMTPQEASWMITLPQISSAVSPLPAALLADYVGRKPVILSAAPFFVLGWTLILCLNTYWALIVARFLQGIGMGIVLSVVPVYLGEIASTKYRGAITSLFFVMCSIGYFFEYCTGPFLSFTNFTLLTLVFSLLFFFTFLFQPETPYFYLMKGNKVSALESLKWLRRSSEDSTRRELETMESRVDVNKEKVSVWKRVMGTPTDRKALYILVIVGMVRSMCGVIPLVSYATSHFQTSSGLQIAPKYITITFGAILLLAAVLSFFILDAIGRRPLLIATLVLSSVCLFISTIIYFLEYKTEVDVSSLAMVPSFLIVIFSTSSVVGVYPVMSAYTSELFTTETRSIASSINVTITTIFGFIEFKLYQDFIDIFGIYFNFLVFGVVCLVGAVISFFYMPETKQKTFKKIREELVLG